ncbi:unnamed protein product [marine sediment metagenome]|uniref:Uncharacterized protein n=1 Tax=marine sediment metagenome TaxID=412755 RepID=X0SG87_9ZZZZ
MQMFIHVLYNPEHTMVELQQLLVDAGMKFYRVDTMGKRLSDLKQMGLVVNAGNRHCNQTGRLAGTWITTRREYPDGDAKLVS